MTPSPELAKGQRPGSKGPRRLSLTVIGPLMIGLVLTFVFGLMLVINIRTGEAGLQRALEVSSQPLVSTAARLLFNPLYILDIETLNDMLARFLGGTNVVYVGVRDTSGQTVAKAGEQWTADEQVGLALAAQALAQNDMARYETADYLVLSSPIAVGSEQIGTVEFAFATAPLRASLGAAQRTISIVILVALVGTILAITAIARVVTRPLGELASVAEEIGRGNLDAPVRVRGMAEIATLAIALEQMRDQLRESYADLEQQVAERTHDLAQRSSYLEATADVGRAAALILDVDQLVQQVVGLIRERFGLYFVGLFLLDHNQEWAILQAGTGEAGQAMLQRGHRRRVGEGMVGWCIANAQARVAADVRADATYALTAELPDTRSEAALPLRSRGRVLGALTVQSDRPGTFDRDTVAVLQTMADQVAVALDNARLFAQSQEALDAERRAYGEISREAWQQMVHTRAVQGYRCDERGVVTIETGAKTGPKQVTEPSGDGRSTVAVPIPIRDQIVGALNFRKASDKVWTDEEIALLKEMAEQLGLALESARLYQDTQRRAAQEQLVGEVTARVRETLDMDTVLQTAVREIGEALGLAEVEVRLGGGATPISLASAAHSGDDGREGAEGDDLNSSKGVPS